MAGKPGDGGLGGERKIFLFFLFSFLILFRFRGRRRGRGGRGYPMSDKTTPTAGRLSTWGPHMNSRFPLRFFTLLFSSPPVFRFSLLNYPHSPSFFSDFFYQTAHWERDVCLERSNWI